MSDPPPPVTLDTITPADLDAFEAALAQAVELYDLDPALARLSRAVTDCARLAFPKRELDRAAANVQRIAPALAAELRAMDLTPPPTEEPDPRPGMDYTPRSTGPYSARDLLFAARAVRVRGAAGVPPGP